ncbi:MAG: lysostaphin resistance A-like protein [Acidimicrobiales bacterium]
MTALVASRPSSGTVWLSATPAAMGLVALLARPWFLPSGVDLAWRVLFFLLLGAVGLAWPLAHGDDLPTRSAALAALGLGTLGFLFGWALMDLPARPPALGAAIALNALAAVAEEAFFRRYLYGLLARWGPAVAIGVSAGAFALVHVTVWGWWVLPLDLAAGLVLSWQRAASGRWSIPAATHVLANTLALL